MRSLQAHEIPVLPFQDMFNGECVAFGVGNIGFIIQFIDRDQCIVIEWPDIIGYGLEVLNAAGKKADDEPEEIAAPTVVE